ncbi:hypothetical protein ED312_21050 [Sinomicrobium pectinilyticum]|uniref:GTP-binding protein n=1 Tax=Sinomicrobium pectinilyticum TaxID=1084421 RepID=A0A3N0DNZ5_SINP1|nr:hypothetical protein [Sinomicrobium pectinilyticum]RNL77358.1 hypothetical protein ED312_21050 [Sinomicrobium pectinilyticum]
MKSLGDKIALDPQFSVELPKNKNFIVSTFLQTSNPLYRVTRSNEHTLIVMSEEEEEWWSPQLHLEVNRIDESRSVLSGWFAPRSSLWNILLYLQLATGIAFMVLIIRTFLNWYTGAGYTLLLILSILMLTCWGTLYTIRKSKKSKGKTLIYGYYEFLNNRSLLN